jgi:hypothetical protein
MVYNIAKHFFQKYVPKSRLCSPFTALPIKLIHFPIRPALPFRLHDWVFPSTHHLLFFYNLNLSPAFTRAPSPQFSDFGLHPRLQKVPVARCKT